MRRLRDHPWRSEAALAALVLSVVAWLAWVVLTGFRADRMPLPTSPYVVAPLALLAGIGLGRATALAARSTTLNPALLGVGLVLIVGVLLTAKPGKAPLGYANANAALAVQVVGLCGLAMLTTPRGRRALLWAALVLGVVAVTLNRSAAGLFVVGPVVAAVGLALWRPPTRLWWPVVLGAATVTAAATVILWLADRTPWPAWALRAFDPVREQLWRDAMALWNQHPVSGGGPGSFHESTLLSADPDTSTAHSSVLQVGSETGWVGVGLFALVALAGFLLVMRGSASANLVGASAWAALLVHSQVDHLLEFTPVVLAAGAVLGWAGATTASEELDVAEREGPPVG